MSGFTDKICFLLTQNVLLKHKHIILYFSVTGTFWFHEILKQVKFAGLLPL